MGVCIGRQTNEAASLVLNYRVRKCNQSMCECIWIMFKIERQKYELIYRPGDLEQRNFR